VLGILPQLRSRVGDGGRVVGLDMEILAGSRLTPGQLDASIAELRPGSWAGV
jgi:hypothetical protein